MSALTDLFTGIANAIRAKKGTTNPIKAENFASEIESIEAGGGTNKLPGVIDGSATVITAEDLGNITSIRNYAFYENSTLSSISFPDSLTSIRNYAFNKCTTLSSISFPDSLTSIGNFAFAYCSELPRVLFPDGLDSIGSSAFNNCTSLSSVSLPDGLLLIGGSAFRGCKALTEITIPSSVTTTSTRVFYECTNLAVVNIHITKFSVKITSYSNSWFFGCPSTLILHIPSSVTNPTSVYGSYWNNYSSGGKLTYYADL